MSLILRYAVRSDLGLVRGNNEDSVYAGPRLLAIADGMGGHAAGEVASKIVIGTLEPLDDDRAPRDLIAALRDSVIDANQRIADAVERDNTLDGMGTTLTALRFVGSQVGLVHVGDSRAYLLRDDVLAQITHDDTYVQYLVDSGKLSPDEAKDHPRKSVILRALRGAEVEPDVSIREARAGDRYLLCSDGLSDVVSTDTIAETMHIPDPQECADRLVELALRSGGPDNVTVIVADVVNARPGDVIDDMPVVAGAFVDPTAADIPGSDSPAERAADMYRTKPDPQSAAATPSPRPRRKLWKLPFLILAALLLLGGGLGGTYAWAHTQYYVGRAGNEVVIYRGVNAAFGPLKFSEVYRDTDLKLADLNQSWRQQVESGITAKDKLDAQDIVTRLHDERKPLCRVTATPSPTASTGSGTGAPTPTTPSGTTPSGTTPSGTTPAGPANAGITPTGTAAGASILRSSVARTTTQRSLATPVLTDSSAPRQSFTSGAIITRSAVLHAIPTTPTVTGLPSAASTPTLSGSGTASSPTTGSGSTSGSSAGSSTDSLASASPSGSGSSTDSGCRKP